MSRPALSPALLTERPELLPDFDKLSQLPEKILQFGTGVLLRGLPDYFVDKANRSGVFNGRIVVVKSTSSGDTGAFQKQGSVFSHAIRGIENGRQVDEFIINSSISRTLSAGDEWHEILQCAHNAALKIVISNTTEVGIQYVQDDVHASPPVSFPGKLTAYLHERFKAFGGSKDSGLVIVPTELIVDNAQKLRETILRQAQENQLGHDFIDWLSKDNYFCSSLVDRIVPGKPDASVGQAAFEEHGFTDDLMIVSEVYRLWAIEGNEYVKSVLSFSKADPGVVIEPNIGLFRELKLRLLNGTHTLTSGYAFLKGIDTVSEAMQDADTAAFVEKLMLDELAPAIPYSVDIERAREFGRQVLDRFRNPFIRHQLIDITVQYTAKMKMRNVPTLLRHYEQSSEVPPLFAQGFAAFLQFMKPVATEDGKYYGSRNGEKYLIKCDSAAYFDQKWKAASSTNELVHLILSDETLWGTDLAALPGFENAVAENLKILVSPSEAAH